MSLAKTVARTRIRSKSREPVAVSFTMREVDTILGAALDLEAAALFLGLLDYVEEGPRSPAHIMILVHAGIRALDKARDHLQSARTVIRSRLRARRGR